jgi:N-acetylglucosamine-6-phosphate deacetylase
MRTESRGTDNPGVSFSVRGRLLLDGRLTLGVVIVRDGRIAEVRTGDLDSNIPTPVRNAHLVSPGLIDLQVNGAFGHEVGGDAQALRALAAGLPATGVTSFLPTLVSGTADDYRAGAAALRAAAQAPGARRLGLHLEGPLLSPTRLGAHDAAAIADAPAALDAVLDGLLAQNSLSLLTLAPEVPGALRLVRRLREAGVVVSLGHTEATFDQFVAGIDAGATLVTHLYNTMRGFQHREPGSVGAALTDDRVTVGIIADGVHAHAAALNLALRAKGWERVVLVTDAVSATGRPPGTYALGGAPVVSDGTTARRLDGTLAGSTLTLDRAVRVMIELGGAHVEEALSMATQVPARLLGREDLGRLAPGCAADLVLWDAAMEVEATYVDGRLAWDRATVT